MCPEDPGKRNMTNSASRRHRAPGRRTISVAAGLATAAAGLSIPLLATPVAAAPAPAPDSIWSSTETDLPRTDDGNKRRVNPDEFRAYDLDTTGLERALDGVPMESASARPSTFTVPSPDGDLVEFDLVESPIMEQDLAAAHPEIKTYAGKATDSAATIRLDVTPMGFHAAVREPGKASWYVDPAYNDDADGTYLSYLGTSLPAAEKGLHEPEGIAEELKADAPVSPGTGEGPGAAVNKRTYRLALVTDTTYARYFGTENVLAEKVTLMNRVNQIYNDDLAIELVLINDSDKLNFDTDAKMFEPNGPCGGAPCYAQSQVAGGCSSGLLNRNRVVLGQVVGARNYDIGHIALGINGGGIAQLNAVGGPGKARGCTGLPQPEGDFMAIDYVAHEMGHQFGGNHTFNGNQASCGGNKAAPSVEPGSGSSVMAYAGICQQDNLQPHTDPYFSQWTQQEVTGYVTSNQPAANEQQTVSLVGFDGTDAFTLTYGGQTTAPITRGTDYTTAGIKAALEAILPSGGTVNVGTFAGGGTLDDTGFSVTFTGSLAGQDVDEMTVAGTSGDVTGFVGDTVKGGALDNNGDTVTETANHNPDVTAADDVTIPARTPFALTGSADDADDDDLVYIWEQKDRGANQGTGLVNQTKTNGPLFRVFGTYANVTPAGTLKYNSPGENLADGNPTRTFPDMQQILDNNTNAMTGACPAAPPPPASGGASNVPIPTIDCFSEWLPTADYVGSTQAGNTEPSLNFRLTARDQSPIGGGYDFADTKVTVDPTAGPFQVSSKNAPAGATAGRTEAVNWLVNGTDDLAENVKISLSVDGGKTWKYVLAESTANDGTEPVTWPDVATDSARIKIEAVDNVFFDVNNADFEITTAEGPETTITSAPKRIHVDTDATIEFESDVEDATFVCTLDGEELPCDDESGLSLTDLSAGTHTVEVAAVDLNHVADPTPATATFTVPRDDRALRRQSGPWQRLSSGAFFEGTVTTIAKKPGATLWADIKGATGLALVAQTNPNSGKVDVFLGKKRLKRIDLSSDSKVNKKVFNIRLDKPTNGTLTLVTVNKKRVKLDGLAVVTAD